MLELLIEWWPAAAYLGTGAVVARRKYANSASPKDARENAIAAAQAELDAIRHYRRCDYVYYGTGCDCSSRGKHRAAQWKLRRAERTSSGPSPYTVMLLFPILGFDSWLRGGKAKVEKTKALAKRIDEMDKYLGLGPYADAEKALDSAR